MQIQEYALDIGRDVKRIHTDAAALPAAGVLDRTAEGQIEYPYGAVKDMAKRPRVSPFACGSSGSARVRSWIWAKRRGSTRPMRRWSAGGPGLVRGGWRLFMSDGANR